MPGRKDLPLLVAESNWIDGVPYIKDVTEETLRKLPDIPVYEDDVYIAGYPKSGNNYSKYIYTACPCAFLASLALFWR